jgi:hypothetical protein
MGEIRERLAKTEAGIEHRMETENQSVGINLNMDQLMALIREMKKPDDETMAAKAAEDKRKKDAMDSMIALTKLEQENRARGQKNCPHEKQDKTSTWYGQVHSDGLIHPICVRCQKEATPYPPPRELISGMGLS